MAPVNQLPLQRVPVTIVGGYLGAGKTTLINRLLEDDHSLRIAVLVNDFGEINVDADLIADHDGQTLALTNGCVCCSIADDLGGALATISSQAPQADHIVIEASGVADPGRIANYAYSQPGLSLDGVVILADCETVDTLVGDRFVGSTVKRQLSAADILLLTKTDLVGAANAAQTADRLKQNYPGAPLIHCGDIAFRWDIIFGANMHQKALMAPLNLHDHTFASTSWREGGTLNRALFLALLRSSQGSILRAKGWVRFDDRPERFTLVQMVGNRIELTDDGPISGERRNGLTFIVVRDVLGVQSLYDAVSSCRSIGKMGSTF